MGGRTVISNACQCSFNEVLLGDGWLKVCLAGIKFCLQIEKSLRGRNFEFFEPFEPHHLPLEAQKAPGDSPDRVALSCVEFEAVVEIALAVTGLTLFKILIFRPTPKLLRETKILTAPVRPSISPSGYRASASRGRIPPRG